MQETSNPLFFGMINNKTWTSNRISLIIAIAFSYDIWFNFLDTTVYCLDKTEKSCLTIVEIFGDDNAYQAWNIAGHFIPH